MRFIKTREKDYNVGQLIFNNTVDIHAGNNTKVINGLNNIKAGVVYYKIQIGSEQMNGKLIKQTF